MYQGMGALFEARPGRDRGRVPWREKRRGSAS
jgi:hypothetical protein